MKILWDLRLFSLGYGKRGIGEYTRRMCTAMLDSESQHSYIAWGNARDIPAEIARRCRIVKGMPQSWKVDLCMPALFALREKCDIFHTWVVLGPFFKIGLPLYMPCPTIGTLYDMGVEEYTDIPHCAALRKTLYWKVQKWCARRLSGVVAISDDTLGAFRRVSEAEKTPGVVAYCPTLPHAASHRERSLTFVTLGGALVKNLRTVIEAFLLFAQSKPEANLIICGAITEEENIGTLPLSVVRDSMEHFPNHLECATAFISCPRHEGLGLPALDAMKSGCPCILADLPAYHETFAEFALFVPWNNPAVLAQAMHQVANHSHEWQKQTAQAVQRYDQLSATAVASVRKLYEEVVVA